MKKVLPFLLFSVIYICSAQTEQVLYPVDLDEESKTMLMSIRDLPVPEHVRSRTLPYKVNNSQTPYYRTPFPQDHLSCGQASSVGMCFTYEIDKKRDLPANVNENLYPTHFVYNWSNGDYGGSGASYYHSLEVLKKVGTPNQAEYGGTPSFGGAARWMSGYDLYYSAMHNRINNAYKIDVHDAEGMQILKNWIYDALSGETPGGCAITYSSNRYPSGTLPAGTEEAGMYVITGGSMSSSHSFTFLGYNDSIRYDYNGDGRYTNDVDINGDGIVNMRDWEIGGLIMSETYFGATAWGNQGFCYVMYKAVADGYLWNYIVHVLDVNHTYSPKLTAKVNMTYTSRKKIKVFAGISSDMSATTPEHIIDFPIFSYQGGEQYMQGGNSLQENRSIEFGLDLTPLLNYVEAGAPTKFFLQVCEDDATGASAGTIDYFAIIDYGSSTPIETACTQQNVDIVNNSITTLSIGITPTFSPVEIISGTLPPAVVMGEYNTELSATGGTEPYRWYFDNDYQVTTTTSAFPAATQTINNNTAIALQFAFPFYDEEFTTVYMNNKGLLVFESNFGTTLPYANVGLETQLFNNNKCITPYHTRTAMSNMHYISEPNSATFIWTSSTLNHAITIYADGRINFYYEQANLPHNTPYIAGVSNGDGENYTTIIFPDNFTVSQGLSYQFSRNPIPEDFELSLDGVMTGTPSREYVGEPIYVKVVDNNGLVDRKTLSLNSEGVILNYSIHTINNNIIEYDETVTLDLVLNNPFPIDLTNISITATCDDPYITLVDNHATLSALNGNASETIFDAFSFEVAGDIPNNHMFRVNFAVETSSNVWNYYAFFPAYAPVFTTGNISVSDGNDNILTCNENVQVSVELTNIGNAIANQVVVSFSTDDPNFTIPSTTPTVYTVPINGSVNFTASVNTSSTIMETYNGTFYFTISTDNGFENVIPFELTVHMPRIDIGRMDNINFLTPGETRDVEFEIHNIGLLPANNITAAISCPNNLITSNTSAQNFSLDVGNNTNISYSLSLSQECQYGEQITCYLTVTGDGGLNYNIPFTIMVGRVTEHFETGDFQDIIRWSHLGDGHWSIVSDNAYEGEYALRSGTITDRQTSVIETDLFVIASGEMSFAYKVSSEERFDWFRFYVDGVCVKEASGDMSEWQTFRYNLTEGDHTLKWSYEKDMSYSRHSDCAWIDYIDLPSFSNNDPQLVSLQQSIKKTMFPETIDSVTLTLANQGGKFEDYVLNVYVDNQTKRSILGSSLTTEMRSFEPGESYDIPFSVYCSSIDNEWIKTIKIQFPEEFTVNRATSIQGDKGTLTWIPVTGNGIESVWTMETSNGGISGQNTANFTVNVTVDEDYRSPESIISYTLIGDVYGSEPHEWSDDIILHNNADFWLTIGQPTGRVYMNSRSDITLKFSTQGLDTGSYYANLRVITPLRSLTIPIELEVVLDNTDIIENTTNKDALQCYPNPFHDAIEVKYYAAENGQIDNVRLFDITGKELMVLGRDQIITAGENLFVYHLTDLSAGVYMLRIESGNDTINQKIVKL